jgi:hypothetical protein
MIKTHGSPTVKKQISSLLPPTGHPGCCHLFDLDYGKRKLITVAFKFSNILQTGVQRLISNQNLKKCIPEENL